MKNKILLALGIVLGFSGCIKNNDYPEPIDPQEQAAMDEKVIQDYFTAKEITDTIADPSGVYIKHITEGTGNSPKLSDRVTVKYELYSLPADNRIPQTEEPVKFILSELISGWQIGIPYMKKGGEAYLYIPSKHAYRDGKVLRFKITLVDF